MRIFANFDRISFWLGFIAACLVLFLAFRLRKNWVPFKEFIIQKFKTIKIKQTTSTDGTLRQDVLRRAQNMHMARTLFALDEVLIVPKLLAQAKLFDPTKPDLIASAQPVVLPNLPLVPQFSAQYSGETLALPRLLRMGVNFAITGHPGMGKSTALAYLATLFAKKDVSLGSLGQYFPIYIHFNDLSLHSSREQDPVKALIKAISWNVSAAQRPQMPGFVQKQVEENKAILLLDGLDEVPDAQYEQALGYLALLLKSRPKLRVVTTASFDRAYGLIELGIEPMPIAGWTRADISHFIARWSTLWNKFLSSNSKSSGHDDEIDELVTVGWQSNSTDFYTPIEWTARLWGAYSGDLAGSRGVDAIESYCARLQTYGVDLERLNALADRLLTTKQSHISYIDAEKLFSEIIIPAATPASDISFEPGNLTQNEVTFQAPNERDKPSRRGSVGERTIDILVDYGLLREDIDEQLYFSSPVIWGYLAALADKSSEFEPSLVLFDTWSVISETLHYRLVSSRCDWLKDYLSGDKGPFYFRTIQAGLWMRDLPAKDQNRAQVLRYLLQYAKADETPYQTKLALLAAASLSNDTAVVQLIRQLAESPDSSIRQIAILCAGMLRDTKSFNSIIGALNDSDLHMRWAACFALVALETADAKKAAKTVLEKSDEPLRLATAEAMAARPPWGHDILKLSETSSDLLTRQAMIFGLLHVHSSWAVDTLERVAGDDSQWAVRSFASQALEYLQKNRRSNNQQFTLPSDSPWLIAYSARQGHGVPKGENLIPVLIQVINSGTEEEKIAAVQLLGRFSDKASIDAVKSCLNSQEADLRRAAFDSLWVMTITRKSAMIA